MAANVDELEHRVTAMLETIAADGATIRDQARQTIVPGNRGRDPSERAYAVMRRLADESAASASARIEVEEPLGEGGMGVVHLATQVTLGRKVAVKTLRPELRNERTTLHLLREAWVTGSLEHPNVVPIYDIGLDADRAPIIVLKRIEGVPWGALLCDADAIRERFGADDALDWNLGILLQVMNAVRFAHTRGIIHRDIKPENVMIGEFGEVYLLDWGIAVSLRDDPTGRFPLAADATDMAGTLCYMAPEMLGGGALSERTDVYLLGATLYELLTGEPPHEGDSTMEIVHSITAAEPPAPQAAPRSLREICRRAMDPDPNGRFERVEQMRLAVQAYRQHRGSERLVDRADENRAAMMAALDDADESPAHRQRLYRLFGEIRFAYREALAQWPQNERARAGLTEVTRRMAGYELDNGDPRAAANLLSELDDPSAEVAAELERARAAEADARARRDKLEALEREQDLTTGTRTRFFIAGVLGTGFTGLPLAHEYTGMVYADNWFMLGFTFAFLALSTALGLWARETLSKTRINRTLAALIAMMFSGQALLYAAAILMDVPAATAQVFMMGFWIVPTAAGTYAVDRRLWPCVIAFSAAFVAAAAWPEQRFLLMAASNFVLMVTAMVIWWPRKEQYPRGMLSR